MPREPYPPANTVRRAFRRRRIRQLAAALLVLAAFLVIVLPDHGVRISLPGVSPDALRVAAGAAILAVLVFTAVNWRCPGCRRYLGRSISPPYCAGCGVPLQ